MASIARMAQSYRQSRAKGLRDHRLMFSFGIGDYYVYTDAKFTAQSIHLIWLQLPEVYRNSVEPGPRA